MANKENSALQYCQANPVKPENIPKLLKSLDRWVVWKTFNQKPDGRFDKIPICPVSQRKISFTEQRNHLPFETALRAYQTGSGDGVGIVLTGEALTEIETGQPLYLIGVDLDNVQTSAEKIDQAKAVCKSIASYAEISPSGTGIQIFALSKKIVGKGQSPSGEMYNSGRFLTVTGHGQNLEVREATLELIDIEKTWWPEKNKLGNTSVSEDQIKPVFPDTPRNRATLYMWLHAIPADCTYELYRNCVWAILSTEWQDAEELAYAWCESAPERFDPVNFDLVVNSFNAEHPKPITIRSLARWAKVFRAHG